MMVVAPALRPATPGPDALSWHLATDARLAGTSARFLADYLVSRALLASIPRLYADLDLNRVFSTARATLSSATASIPLDAAILALYNPPRAATPPAARMAPSAPSRRAVVPALVPFLVIHDAIRRSEIDPDPNLAAHARSAWRNAVSPRPTAWHAVLDRLLFESRTNAPVRTARRLLSALVDLVKRGELEVVGKRYVRRRGWVEVNDWTPVLVAPLVTSFGVGLVERVVAGLQRSGGEVVSHVDAVRIVTRAAGWTEDVMPGAPCRIMCPASSHRHRPWKKRAATGGDEGHVRKARREEEVEEGQVRHGEGDDEGARYGLPKDKGDWLVALA
ncbi:hypothetical protein GGF31_002429 [Allomyces arbusculus]|nr:hypothetical protein GGF31_002429 [Allomyces arbusculus]